MRTVYKGVLPIKELAEVMVINTATTPIAAINIFFFSVLSPPFSFFELAMAIVTDLVNSGAEFSSASSLDYTSCFSHYLSYLKYSMLRYILFGAGNGKLCELKGRCSPSTLQPNVF
jgi:hypothetical protein